MTGLLVFRDQPAPAVLVDPGESGVFLFRQPARPAGPGGGTGGGGDGTPGRGIVSIAQTGQFGLQDTYTITYTDGTTTEFIVTNGGDGWPGKGVTGFQLIEGDHSPGTTDTYQMSFSDDTYELITVYNGRDGVDGQDGVDGAGGGGTPYVPPTRTTATVTTGTLANNVSENVTLTMAKGYRLLRLQVDRACRVRVYTTTAKRSADAARAIGTDPVGDHGLIFEYVATGPTDVALSPLVDGFNDEDPASDNIAVSIQNLSGSSGTVTLTTTYLRTEA